MLQFGWNWLYDSAHDFNSHQYISLEDDFNNPQYISLEDDFNSPQYINISLEELKWPLIQTKDLDLLHQGCYVLYIQVFDSVKQDF